MRLKKYKNDIAFIHERVKGFKGIGIGIYVRCGSMNETDKNSGISHILEHMMFKGTESKNNIEINKLFDLYSINFNASTSKDMTSYYALTIKDNLEKVAELLSDIFFNSVFPEDQLELEKNVIINELKDELDSDDDLCYLNLNKITFKDSRRSLPIIGKEEVIKNVTSKDLKNYKDEMYTSKNIVFGIFGDISFKEAENIAEKYFLNKAKVSNESNSKKITKLLEYDKKNYISVFKKDTQQANIGISYSNKYRYSEKRYAISKIIEDIMLNGMSSRIYEHVREKKGLCYSIYLIPQGEKNDKKLSIFSSSSSNDVKEILETINYEIDRLHKDKITEEEFNNAKIRAINKIVAMNDSILYRLQAAASKYLILNEKLNLSSLIETYKNIKYDEVIQVIDSTFEKKDVKVSYVGKELKNTNMKELYNIVKGD